MTSSIPSTSSSTFDPLSDVIAHLRPRTVFAKSISGAGRWGVSYSAFGQPSFCAVLDGRCRLRVAQRPAVTLEAGDFVLLPATPAFTSSGLEAVAVTRQVPRADGAGQADVRHGRRGGPPDVRLLGGWCVFDTPDAALLVSLLPGVVHVSGVERLSTLVRLLAEEASAVRPGRDLLLTRLVEALLIEALRTTPQTAPSPGLLRGLADPALAAALRHMHQHLTRRWTVADLARVAGLSRSAFYDRFTGAVGTPPMDYLQRWRLSVAKDLLQRERLSVAEVAARVGYEVATSFSTAFGRATGMSPRAYAATFRASSHGRTPAATDVRRVPR